MPIQTIYDVGDDYQITPKIDGNVYRSGIKDCVCQGTGDEFALNYSSSSLNVTFNAGSQAIVCGSFFKLTGNDPETVALPANKTFFLCARIDLSRQNGQRGYFACIEGSGNVYTSTNTNGNDSIHDLILYQITTDASGVTSVSDKRTILGSGSASVGGYTIAVMTQSAYNSLSTKDANTLYFLY